MFKDNIDKFFSKLEWRWSLANMLWGSGVLASAVLPAWAVSVMSIFSDYAPLSWVASGMIGFLLFCFGFFVYARARERLVTTRFNARAIARGSTANPLDKIFERQRIFLNDFALPSNMFVHDKTFIDCEIVGPCNIFLAHGNRIDEAMLPRVDAAVLPPDVTIFNSLAFSNCSFRRCSFQRVTFFVSRQEYDYARHFDWLNWVSYRPDSEFPIFTQVEDQSSQSEEKKTDESRR